MNPKIRNKFSQYERKPFINTGEDPAQQHFRDEVNINNIIAKYNRTGVISHVAKTRARFGEFKDFAEVLPDFDRVTKAQQSFDSLPATIRNEFGNSIEGFFKFIGNPANRTQCEKWGIFDPPKSPTPAQQAAGEPSPQATKTGKMKKPVTTTPQESSDD